MQKILLALALMLVLCLPSWAGANPNQIQFGCQVVDGMQNQYPNVLLQYQEPSTTTCQFSGAIVVPVFANSTNTQINTATIFGGFTVPVLVGIQEITSPSLPVNIGLTSSGPRLQLAPGGILVVRLNAGFPTFYVDNTSTNSTALLRVFMLSN